MIKYRIAAIISIIGFVVDRILKTYAISLQSGEIFSFGSVFEFGYFLNPALFFLPPWRFITWIALITLLALFGFWIWHFIKNWKLSIDNSRSCAILFIILGGASNVFDRFAYNGVIDIINILGFATTNLADLLIVVGIIELLRTKSNTQTFS